METLNLNSHLLPFAIGILIMVGVFIANYIYKANISKKFLSLSHFLNEQVVKGFFGVKFKGNYKGADFEIKNIMGSKNSPPRLAIALLRPNRITASVRKANIGFSALEKLGLMKRVKTNNREFDEKFFICSKDTLSASSFFSSQTVLESVKTIFTGGYYSIIIEKSAIKAVTYYRDLKSALNEKKMLSILDNILKLSGL